MGKEKNVSDLSELIENENHSNEPKKKGFSLIEENFTNKMSPEELKAWRAKAAAKRRATWEEKRRKKAELVSKAEALIPQVLAIDLASKEMQSPDFTPSQDMIDKIKYLIDRKNGLSIEELRTKHFKNTSDETWHRLMKFVFKSQISQSEDLGAELLRAKQNQIKRIKAHKAMVKKEIKLHKKKSLDGKLATIPVSLLQMLADDDEKLLQIEMDVAKTLFQVGAVGEKSKAPSLHVHMSVPRPPKKESKQVVDA